jgi:hypothetical protein
MPLDDLSIAAAVGYLQLGMIDDAWEEMECLPPEQRGSDEVIGLRIEIYQRLKKWKFLPSARGIDGQAMPGKSELVDLLGLRTSSGEIYPRSARSIVGGCPTPSGGADDLIQSRVLRERPGRTGRRSKAS